MLAAASRWTVPLGEPCRLEPISCQERATCEPEAFALRLRPYQRASAWDANDDRWRSQTRQPWAVDVA